MSTDYERFLASKLVMAQACGIPDPGEITSKAFPFQRDIIRWALRRGKAACFADCGLGKGLVALEWSRHVAVFTDRPVLILAPLAVAQQFVREAERFEIKVTLCKSGDDVRPGINVTNYDRLHLFDASDFGGVVCDESGCLKSHDSATRNQLIAEFRETRFKLCCSATPSPNDFTELGNHAEFLGIMSRVEMLSMWFVHDGSSTQDWRLKGHARRSFWAWISSWGLMVKSPSDLGYPADGYDLPPLEMHEHVVPSDLAQAHAAGVLFVQEAHGLTEQRKARRASIDARVAACTALVAAEPKEQWLIFCELNDEGNALQKAIPNSVQVAGSDSNEDKEERLLGFAEGRVSCCISKVSIAGWGLNFQRCARVVFIAPGNSFEGFYQGTRRVHRFGQDRPVHCHLFVSEAEGAVLANLKRKQAEAEEMANEMRAFTKDLIRDAVAGATRESVAYKPTVRMTLPPWLEEAS